jgi:hypothetical protein
MSIHVTLYNDSEAEYETFEMRAGEEKSPDFCQSLPLLPGQNMFGQIS